MLDAIKSNKLFKPEKSLKIKYWLYVITIIAVIWVGIWAFIGFIGLVANEAPPVGLTTIYTWMIAIGSIIILISYPLVVLYSNSISYEIVEDEVHAFRGIITQTRKIVPYRTITNLEIKRGPYDRLLNLGTIEIQTAGNSANKIGPEERIDGLPGDLVEEIQEILVNKVRKMRGSAGISHDIPDEESLLAEILFEVKELRKYLQNT